MCGLPQPDPMKTCISVRLPWNPAPMYFCTEKSTFRYKNQCQNRYSNQCGLNTIRQDTLMVASPWDCCPLVSFPGNKNIPHHKSFLHEILPSSISENIFLAQVHVFC